MDRGGGGGCTTRTIAIPSSSNDLGYICTLLFNTESTVATSRAQTRIATADPGGLEPNTASSGWSSTSACTTRRLKRHLKLCFRQGSASSVPCNGNFDIVMRVLRKHRRRNRAANRRHYRAFFESTQLSCERRRRNASECASEQLPGRHCVIQQTQ